MYLEGEEEEEPREAGGCEAVGAEGGVELELNDVEQEEADAAHDAGEREEQPAHVVLEEAPPRVRLGDLGQDDDRGVRHEPVQRQRESCSPPQAHTHPPIPHPPPHPTPTPRRDRIQNTGLV